MELGLGVLGWTPDTFWNSTPFETSCAYIGYCKANGAGRWAVHKDGWSDADLEVHIAEVDELKRRFPDGPLDRETRRKLKEARRRG